MTGANADTRDFDIPRTSDVLAETAKVMPRPKTRTMFDTGAVDACITRTRAPTRAVAARAVTELNMDLAVERTVVATGAITAGSVRAIAAIRDMAAAGAPIAANVRPSLRTDVDTVKTVADIVLADGRILTNVVTGAVIACRAVAMVRVKLPVADTNEASVLAVVR